MIDILCHLLLLLLMPPLLIGIIGKTKAACAGRVGPPLLQPYYDLAKLLRKESVYSETTTWVFRAGPVVGLATTLMAGLLLPLGSHPAPIAFTGDLVLFAYLFGLGRFFTVAAALDTGSSFEGMGGAREASYSALAEPTLFFALAALARLSGSLSLTPMLHGLVPVWSRGNAALILLAFGLFIVLLAENCRVPFDDPATHLELTMIHEVMVLDHSGPGFAFILYGAALKLFVTGAFFLQMVAPVSLGSPVADWGLVMVSLCGLAIGIGLTESFMARLRLTRVPQLLVAGTILTGFALVLTLR